MDWASGYVTEIGYTPHYYSELNPTRASLPLLMAGVKPPTVRTACELGFGQGVSLVVHAATTDAAWYGCDINPSHVSHAQGLLDASGVSAKLYADSFAEFCGRDDIPDFDMIALHGVWSWVDAHSKAIITDFIARKLRVGGLVYVSYNTLPGWSQFEPLRHLMCEFAERETAPGLPLEAKIDAALAHVDQVIAADPTYFRVSPVALERFKQLRTFDRRYLAHEFFNRAWTPGHVSDMAQTLRGARLTYVGSAHPLDHVDGVNLTPAQADILRNTADPIHRETLRDLFTNQQFRRDFWMKGPVRLDPAIARAALADVAIAALRPRSALSLKAQAARGEVSLKDEAFALLLDSLAAHSVATIGDLASLAHARGITFRQTLEAIVLLVSNGSAAVAQNTAPPNDAALRFNGAVADHALVTRETRFTLAAPRLGGGVAASRAQTLLLGALLSGQTHTDGQINSVLQRLATYGQSLAGGVDADRIALQTASKEVEALAPLWRALGVAPAAPMTQTARTRHAA